MVKGSLSLWKRVRVVVAGAAFALAACGEAAPAQAPTASRGIVISSLPTATRAPAQQSPARS